MEAGPRESSPRMHSTRRTSHLLSSSWTLKVSRKGFCLGPLAMTSAFFGLGKKSTMSTTPTSWI